MTPIYVDATTLIALGTIGELELLDAFDGRCIVLPSIRDEVTGEPAATNIAHAIESERVTASRGWPYTNGRHNRSSRNPR